MTHILDDNNYDNVGTFQKYQEGDLAVLESQIGKMVNLLRRQAQGLQEDKTILQNAMADISHQLKTPMTSLHLLMSMLADENLEQGEFLAIIGPSGSGISTLLHILGGVDRPSSGKVYMNGSDVYVQDDTQLAIFRRRQVGLIYQFYNLIPVLNVVENMVLPVRLDRRKVNKRKLAELPHILGLKGRESHLPNQLSGGQQQRVSIGRALMNSPAIVLVDEPTGNLDSQNSHELMELLKLSNRKYNQTLIMITHDENIALQADRILSIEDGRIVRDEVIG